MNKEPSENPPQLLNLFAKTLRYVYNNTYKAKIQQQKNYLFS
jgi:hypothetical protein